MLSLDYFDSITVIRINPPISGTGSFRVYTISKLGLQESKFYYKGVEKNFFLKSDWFYRLTFVNDLRQWHVTRVPLFIFSTHLSQGSWLWGSTCVTLSSSFKELGVSYLFSFCSVGGWVFVVSRLPRRGWFPSPFTYSLGSLGVKRVSKNVGNPVL